MLFEMKKKTELLKMWSGAHEENYTIWHEQPLLMQTKVYGNYLFKITITLSLTFNLSNPRQNTKLYLQCV